MLLFVLFFSCIVLYYIALHCIVWYCIALHCMVLYCIALHYIALHCIALYCIVLYCIQLYGPRITAIANKQTNKQIGFIHTLRGSGSLLFTFSCRVVLIKSKQSIISRFINSLLILLNLAAFNG